MKDTGTYRFEVSFRKSLKIVSYTFIFNTLIALFLALMVFPGKIGECLIMSQSIGLSICIFTLTSLHVLKPVSQRSQYIVSLCAIGLGIAVGISIGIAATGLELSVLHNTQLLLKILFISLVFGFMIPYFFLYQDRYFETRSIAQEERIKRLLSEKRRVEVELKMLQAQIEPHFLYNTLFNIQSLLDSDGEKGKQMLQDLTRYLRVALSKSRAERTTIGEEVDLLRSYLNIFKLRMGERLQFTIEIPDEMKAIVIAPMLLQPLVENAIKHGLEPKINGGKIIIRGKMDKDRISLEVIDSGLGFQEGPQQGGVGLINIRERLLALYGDQGRLVLKENPGFGLQAVIEVPYGTD